MRIVVLTLLAASLLACEREEMEVEDTVFQHGIEYMDKAEEAEQTLMDGAEARRRAMEQQEQ
jgi:hypothetical protein